MAVSILSSTAAARLDSEVRGSEVNITRIDTIADGVSGSLTFIVDGVKYAQALRLALSRGAAVLVPHGTEGDEQLPGCMIPVENPRFAFAYLVSEFFVPEVEAGIADTARVHPTARIHPSAHIGEFTVVREGVEVGANSEIRDHVVVGRNVRIGSHALIKSHAVIGEEGLGIEKDPAGHNYRIPHLGAVVLGDHVEIGSHSSVSSGTIRPTVVGDFTKVSDNVIVAHNSRIGRDVVIAGGTILSGSVTIEDGAWLGTNTSMREGIVIAQDALLGVAGVALESIPQNEVRAGNPARRIRDRH